jgi:hypothetical protein
MSGDDAPGPPVDRAEAWPKGMIGGPGDPLQDGRQSDAALAIQRGTRRLLAQHGWTAIPEVGLANGRRADLAALSEAGDIWIVEIKSSLADLRADQKWPEYRDFCDRLSFAVAPNFPLEALPEDVGILLADRYGGEEQRPPPEHRLPAARRKAMLIRLARIAASRLHVLADPLPSR